MKKVLALILALACMFSLAACGGSAAPASSDTAAAPASSGSTTAAAPAATVTPADPGVKYKDTVRISNASEIQNGAYYSVTSAQSSFTGMLTHEPPFRTNYQTGEADPILAKEAVDVNGDGLTWKMTLKEGVMFHMRGEPYQEMKASDLKWTYEYTAVGGPGASEGVIIRTNSTMTYVDSIDVDGDYELTFHLNTALFDFPKYCTFAVLCEKAMEEFGTSDGQECSTGPYYLNNEETVAGQYWTCTRFDDYWGGIEDHPTKNIVFVLHADANTGVAALQAGEVDVRIGVSATHALTFENNPDFQLATSPSLQLNSLFWNSYDKTGFFAGEDTEDQIKLRQAIVMAIDKDKLVSIIYAVNPSAGQRWDSLWGPTTTGYVDTGKTEFNIEKACKMMEELGYNANNRLPLRLAHYPSMSNFAEILQDMLGEIYIDVEDVTLDSSVYGNAIRSGEGWDMCLNYYEPRSTVGGVMASNLRSTGSNAASYGWGSEEMDKRIDEVMAQPTLEGQLKAFAEFQEWANQYFPRVPIYVPVFFTAMSADVEGYVECRVAGERDFSHIRIPE